MTSLRNVVPALRSVAMVAAMSGTATTRRFQPPGWGVRPFGMARAALLDGPASHDIVLYDDASVRGVDVDLRITIAQNTIGSERDELDNIDSVSGSPYHDAIDGNGDDNCLHGQAGDDFPWGEGADDTLEGSGGNDTLNGGNGTDTADHHDRRGGHGAR